MSTKEPAIRLLKERYSESFAFTVGARQNQVHLFMIKLGLWSLVMTFTPRHLSDAAAPGGKIEIEDVMLLVEKALSGDNSALADKLDSAVKGAEARIASKLREFNKG
jgi:hypothetical protein